MEAGAWQTHARAGGDSANCAGRSTASQSGREAETILAKSFSRRLANPNALK